MLINSLTVQYFKRSTFYEIKVWPFLPSLCYMLHNNYLFQDVRLEHLKPLPSASGFLEDVAEEVETDGKTKEKSIESLGTTGAFLYKFCKY